MAAGHYRSLASVANTGAPCWAVEGPLLPPMTDGRAAPATIAKQKQTPPTDAKTQTNKEVRLIRNARRSSSIWRRVGSPQTAAVSDVHACHILPAKQKPQMRRGMIGLRGEPGEGPTERGIKGKRTGPARRHFLLNDLLNGAERRVKSCGEILVASSRRRSLKAVWCGADLVIRIQSLHKLKHLFSLRL